MKNKVIKRLCFLVLIALSALLNAGLAGEFSQMAADRQSSDEKQNISDRYLLPPSKVNIEPCRREALRLYRGAIEKQQIVHQNGEFRVRFEIQSNDGSEGAVLCDLATGKVIDKPE